MTLLVVHGCIMTWTITCKPSEGDKVSNHWFFCSEPCHSELYHVWGRFKWCQTSRRDSDEHSDLLSLFSLGEHTHTHTRKVAVRQYEGLRLHFLLRQDAVPESACRESRSWPCCPEANSSTEQILERIGFWPKYNIESLLRLLFSGFWRKQEKNELTLYYYKRFLFWITAVLFYIFISQRILKIKYQGYQEISSSTTVFNINSIRTYQHIRMISLGSGDTENVSFATTGIKYVY